MTQKDIDLHVGRGLEKLKKIREEIRELKEEEMLVADWLKRHMQDGVKVETADYTGSMTTTKRLNIKKVNRLAELPEMEGKVIYKEVVDADATIMNLDDETLADLYTEIKTIRINKTGEK